MTIRLATAEEAAYYGALFVLTDDFDTAVLGIHEAPPPNPSTAVLDAKALLTEALALGAAREFNWFAQRTGIATFMLHALNAARILLGLGAELVPIGGNHPLDVIARTYTLQGVSAGDAALTTYLNV